MSTNDVPGYKAANNDVLAMGCWAEHEDGSLIFVESVENYRVIYSIFDMAKAPIVEYRDAMPETDFNAAFSWQSESKVSKKARGVNQIKWTWHDKTRFPWERVIKDGAKDGMRFACAADLRNAAERVADSLKLRAQAITDKSHMMDSVRSSSKVGGFLRSLANALDGLDQPRSR